MLSEKETNIKKIVYKIYENLFTYSFPRFEYKDLIDELYIEDPDFLANSGFEMFIEFLYLNIENVKDFKVPVRLAVEIFKEQFDKFNAEHPDKQIYKKEVQQIMEFCQNKCWPGAYEKADEIALLNKIQKDSTLAESDKIYLTAVYDYNKKYV